jgi:hypothetical protein
MDLHLFQALAYALMAEGGTEQSMLLSLELHRQQMHVWAALNPGNFEEKAVLLDAEQARLSGGPLKALALYEKATLFAGRQGFVHIQAFAHELAARHCFSCDLHVASRAHLDSAKRCYRQWGASAKVIQLEMRYPGWAPYLTTETS